MKSRTSTDEGFIGLSLTLFTEIQGFLGISSREASRDYERFRSLVENRGVSYLTLDLPAMGKIFDRALAEGRLPNLSEPGFGSKKKGTVLPVFLQEMWSRVFDSGGLLLVEPDVATIACFRQFFYCFKKARLPCDPNRVTEAFDDFLRVDEDLRVSSLDWDDPLGFGSTVRDNHIIDGSHDTAGYQQIMDCFLADHDAEASKLLDVVQHCCDIIAWDLGAFHPEEHRPKHGRGAVADAKLGKSFKYEFPNWPAKLESVFPLSIFGYANEGLWADAVANNDYLPGTDEVPSRLITVPKDMRGPRLIAAEPTANQYCQQSILSFLVRGVHTGILRSVINFADQGPSRTMALSASARDDYSTIDLSSASDRVSCWLVERAFRCNPSLLVALAATRTSSVEFPDGNTWLLRKFTTMGAATTFPIQSIIYAMVIHGVGAWLEGCRSYAEVKQHITTQMSAFRVFGDDLIVPSDSTELVIGVLTHLGFRINQTKTFTKGNFRESCGMDAWNGVDVTPSYVLDLYNQARPSTLASVVESANNLFIGGWWKTAAELTSTVPSKLLNEVPVVAIGSGCPGRVSFSGSDTSALKSRWNRDLQRMEYRIKDVCTSVKRVSPGGNASLLQYFLEAPDPSTEVIWSSGYDERPRLVVRSRWVVSHDLF